MQRAQSCTTSGKERLSNTGKRDLIHTEIIAPNGAPDWAKERGQLWNQVERAEKRKDSTTAREFTLALPCELDRAQQIETVRGFVREQISRRGLLADISIHEPERIDGGGKQPHAHVLISTRALEEGGAFAAKKLDWLTRPKHAETEMKELRSAWADAVNQALKCAGRQERVASASRADQAAALAAEAANENRPFNSRLESAEAARTIMAAPPESKIGYTVVAQARREISEIARKTGEVIQFADHLVARSPAAAQVLTARSAARAPAARFVSRLSRILDHGRTVAGPGRFFGVDATAPSDVGATIDVRSRATEPERTPNSGGNQHSDAIDRNWGRIIEIASAIGDRVFRISKGINTLIDEKYKENDDYIKSRRHRDEAERLLELTLNRVKTAERIRQLEMRRIRGRGRGR
jgi:hypothetical protein